MNIDPQTLVGKTIESVDNSSDNVLHIKFTDGTEVSVSYDYSGIPGLCSIEVQEKWK